MGRKGLLIVLSVILVMTAIFVSSVSAQDVDISNMDNAQLMQLLQAIMLKLGSPDDPAAQTVGTEEISEPEGTPVPDEYPEKSAFSIWKNKKLMIEALPDYMFIQKIQNESENEQEPGKNQKPPNPPEHYENEPDTDEYGSPCHWTLWEGKWYCMKG